MTMPIQKPHRSEQVVCTPPDFIKSVMNLLGDEFGIDLAASQENSVSQYALYTEEDNALDPQNGWISIYGGWAWCNPPYSDIKPWVEKAWSESQRGAKIAMLVPASVGSKWWSNWVDNKAHVLFLQPRLTFVGHEHPYPKDLALLLYTRYVHGGSRYWRWNE